MGIITRALPLVIVLWTFSEPAFAELEDGRLGSRCSATGACLDGLSCMLPADGLLAGVCTLPCSSDYDCDAIHYSATCVEDLGICAEGCPAQNASSEAALDPARCHGRDDMACMGLDCSEDFYCYESPNCVSYCTRDDQCAADLHCNTQTGRCQSDPPPDAARNCLLGVEVACSAFGPDEPERACLGSREPTSPGYGGDRGDTVSLGTCIELCNCTTDCAEGERCVPRNFEGPFEALGRCTPGDEALGAADCLSAGSASCLYGAVRACKTADCLGTAECLADGTYASCQCLPDGLGGAAGAAGAAGADSSSPARAPQNCGCRVAGVGGQAAWGWALALLVVMLKGGRRRHGT